MGWSPNGRDNADWRGAQHDQPGPAQQDAPMFYDQALPQRWNEMRGNVTNTGEGKLSRPRKSGRRTKSERLSRAKLALAERNPPSAKALARQDRFRHFRGDGSIGHEMTCAGRLMLVGAFDGMDLAPEVILSALLDYQSAYWTNFGGGAQIADYGRIKVDGTPPPVAGKIDHETKRLIDAAGEWFEAKDAMLRSAGHNARMTVHAVTVDRHFFPDEDVSWAARIINSRILDKRKAMVRAGTPVPSAMIVIGEIACDSDWAMLELLRFGAAVLATGSDQRRRAA